ncbi:CinA family protein [Actinotalea sp. BY-33]|uniref:CinA family protein n=1 Tax=Actinotalea soli TaxID=2819234 RepID=A0A939LNF7_9CELL|nr:CinA family protein [Actinotalea soli]MBO1751006.1 CinA family protein [Actinotalea soli]
MRRSVDENAHAAEHLASGLADGLAAHGWTVATAESLTGGTIASVLSAAPAASTWFRGSIVAYSPEVKFGLLKVPRGPVVTEACATQMASRTAELLGAEVAVAVTGVGGPEPDEGQPPGSVWFAVVSPAGTHTEKLVVEGDPPAVLAATSEHAITLLHRVARGELP